MASSDTEDDSFYTYSILVGVVILAVVGLYLALRKKGAKGNTVLLLGLNSSGKTVLFQQLRDGSYVNTVTSMKENEDTYIPTKLGLKKEIHVVDIPGSLRLRPKLKDFVPITRGIIFLIDSVEFDNDARNISEFLHSLFTTKQISKKKIPVLIACNKQDNVTAMKKLYIKVILQKELDKFKQTKRSIPDQLQDESSEEITLGVEGEPFAFHQLDNEVSFGECSSKQGEIKEIVEFIDQILKWTYCYRGQSCEEFAGCTVEFSDRIQDDMIHYNVI